MNLTEHEAGVIFWRVIEAVAKVCDVHFAVIIGRSRTQYPSQARHLAMALCRDNGLNVYQVAKRFERDRRLIVFAARHRDDMVATDPIARAHHEQLQKMLAAQPAAAAAPPLAAEELLRELVAEWDKPASDDGELPGFNSVLSRARKFLNGRPQP